MEILFRSLNNTSDWEWFHSHNETLLLPDMRGIIAYDKETGNRLAGVVLNTWTKTSVHAHMVSLNPIVMRHGFLQELFNYVFIECGRIAIYGSTPSNNVKALRLIKHVGFKEIITLKDAFNIGVDAVLTEIRKEDCKYL